MEIRNIAIIAHVDHGKTTLVDRILHATKVFRDNQETGELIMDNNDLERERGITIFSKNAAVTYNGIKINVIDTPGHSDFGGEVERVLKMADGVILLVDAFEGPMPQTRFVLQKALQLNLHPIVVINKVDKANCRPDEVHDAVFELFFNLDATEEQLNFPTYYGSGKNGWFNDSLTPTDNILPLMDGILKYVPAPKVSEGTLQLQITSLDYSSFLGRIAVGKVTRGSIKENQLIALVQADGSVKKSRVKELYVFEGMGKRKVTEVLSGDLCAVVGLEDFNIGDTIADAENPEALPIISVLSVVEVDRIPFQFLQVQFPEISSAQCTTRSPCDEQCPFHQFTTHHAVEPLQCIHGEGSASRTASAGVDDVYDGLIASLFGFPPVQYFEVLFFVSLRVFTGSHLHYRLATVNRSFFFTLVLQSVCFVARINDIALVQKIHAHIDRYQQQQTPAM